MTSDSDHLDRVTVTAERVLRDRLAGVDLDHVEVTAGEDHDGDRALFIDAYYHLMDSSIDPGPFYGVIGAVRRALIDELGEERFPYIRHHFDERQKVAV